MDMSTAKSRRECMASHKPQAKIIAQQILEEHSKNMAIVRAKQAPDNTPPISFILVVENIGVK
jgi:hypothetical protein